MNLNRVIQSVLIMLAVVGVFAAMARNAYGFDFIGIACLGLAVLFLFQLVWKVLGEYSSLHRADIPEMLELFLLSLLTLMFGLRALYIYLDYSQIIFNTVSVLQSMVYAVIGYEIIIRVRKESKPLAQKLTFFYSSILLFLLFLAFGSQVKWSVYIGVLALIVAVPFLTSVILQTKFEFESKSVSLFRVVVKSKNKAGLLFLFFVSASLFTGLNYWGVVPSIENADRPKDYIELINQAETGKEKPVDGRYQHEQYREAMDKFMERHGKK